MQRSFGGGHLAEVFWWRSFGGDLLVEALLVELFWWRSLGGGQVRCARCDCCSGQGGLGAGPGPSVETWDLRV